MKAFPKLVADLLADPATAVCPACGGVGFYDNRTSKKNPKAPDFKCRAPNCDDGNGRAFGAYVPKEGPGAAPQGGAGKGPAVRVTWPQMRTAYAECISVALKAGESIGKQGMPVNAPEIAAMAATLFIQRGQANCWPALSAPSEAPVAPPKPQPAPAVRRPPSAMPRPVQDDEGPYGDDDSSLPF